MGHSSRARVCGFGVRGEDGRSGGTSLRYELYSATPASAATARTSATRPKNSGVNPAGRVRAQCVDIPKSDVRVVRYSCRLSRWNVVSSIPTVGAYTSISHQLG